MGNVKPINSRKYNISKHKFYELYHHCLQYDEWKDELKYATDTMKSKQITDMPIGSGTGDATGDLGIRRAELSQKCKVLEDTAKEVDPVLWEYILKGVTDEYASYIYLSKIMNIPCGKNQYYDKRRMFFYLLSKKL